MLCDVALGNMYEATKAEYVEKLPTGFHSTKGLGKTAPDPANVKEIDGSTVGILSFRVKSNGFLLQVPIGNGAKDSNLKTDLLYNEFIVYDIAQVNRFDISISNDVLFLGQCKVFVQNEVQLQNLKLIKQQMSICNLYILAVCYYV